VRPSIERGFALLLALAVLLLVAAAVIMALRVAVSGKDALQRERRIIELRAATDAALAETMAALDEDPAFSGLASRTFAGGSIGSSVSRREDGTVEVTAVARVGGWGMTLRAIVRADRPGAAEILSWRRSSARPETAGSVSVLE